MSRCSLCIDSRRACRLSRSALPGAYERSGSLTGRAGGDLRGRSWRDGTLRRRGGVKHSVRRARAGASASCGSTGLESSGTSFRFRAAIPDGRRHASACRRLVSYFAGEPAGVRRRRDRPRRVSPFHRDLDGRATARCRGQVVSYGELAALAGRPRSAARRGNVLRPEPNADHRPLPPGGLRRRSRCVRRARSRVQTPAPRARRVDGGRCLCLRAFAASLRASILSAHAAGSPSSRRSRGSPGTLHLTGGGGVALHLDVGNQRWPGARSPCCAASASSPRSEPIDGRRSHTSPATNCISARILEPCNGSTRQASSTRISHRAPSRHAASSRGRAVELHTCAARFSLLARQAVRGTPTSSFGQRRLRVPS